MVEHACLIAIIPILLALSIPHVAQAIIRALLIVLSTAVVARAKTSASSDVDAAALFGHAADLIGGTPTAAGATACSVLDEDGAGAAILSEMLRRGHGGHG